MTLTMTEQVARSRRLIMAATGDEYGDSVEMHHYTGNVEPGYDDQPMITADWNDKSTYDRETSTRTVTDTRPGRLFDALERWCPDIQLDWCDEWSSCGECGKAVRSTGNSYSWTPSYAILGDDFVCHECIADDPTAYLETLTNNAHSANTMLDADYFEGNGYEQHNGTYASGWFDGQTDDPVKILGLLDTDANEFVFDLTEQSQFYARFTLWFRPVA